MKNPERVAALLAELRTLAETDFERHRIDVLERDLHEPPTVEQIDDTHQKFDGVTFSRPSEGRHFQGNISIQRAVWSYYFGEIPNGYHVHHVDENKANNAIENLQCLSKAEHRTIHNARGKNRHKVAEFVCINCGKHYLAEDIGTNKFCSAQCSHEYYVKQDKNYETRICQCCGQQFKAWKSSHVKCCSLQCAQQFRWRDNQVTLICPICGKEFTRKSSKLSATCSRTCGAKLMWQRRHGQ